MRFEVNMNKFSNKKNIAVWIAIGLCALISGCTTPQQESDIPWNTPASWEGQGVLGGMLNGGGY